MKKLFLHDQNLKGFVEALLKHKKIVGPVQKMMGPKPMNAYVFETVHSFADLRLDYTTTQLPPKKVFFPPYQDLVKFDGKQMESCISPEEQILFGVHTHDIKGIDMTDFLFAENHRDNNYLANREATTIIGMTPQQPFSRAFFGSINTHLQPKGHDMMCTKIKDGYYIEVTTEKGNALVPFGTFSNATTDQENEANHVIKHVNESCPEKLNYSIEEIAVKVRNSFDSPIWKELAEKCFSCGTCNIVCPTCYCFDVQDQWNLDQTSGTRFRTWDACLTQEFAEVSVQGGSENFRENQEERYRHRVMRKLTYLNKKLGGAACTGCGRCSAGCTIDIADPVNIINRLMESK